MELPKVINNISERVIDDLQKKLSVSSTVSIAAASFSIYAFEALQKELEKVDELKRKKRRLRNELDDREEEVSQQRKSMITELEQRMVKQTEQQNLFVIRWKVKEN